MGSSTNVSSSVNSTSILSTPLSMDDDDEEASTPILESSRDPSGSSSPGMTVLSKLSLLFLLPPARTMADDDVDDDADSLLPLLLPITPDNEDLAPL